jgi:hypothetical protein
MVTTKRLLLPLYLCVTLMATAACSGDTPSGATPAGARHSGIGFGSGNVAPTDSTKEQQSTNAAPVESDSTGAARGIGFGSGN